MGGNWPAFTLGGASTYEIIPRRPNSAGFGHDGPLIQLTDEETVGGVRIANEDRGRAGTLQSRLANALLLRHVTWNNWGGCNGTVVAVDRTNPLVGRGADGNGRGGGGTRSNARRLSRGLGFGLARIPDCSDSDVARRSHDGLRLGLGDAVLEGSGR